MPLSVESEARGRETVDLNLRVSFVFMIGQALRFVFGLLSIYKLLKKDC